MDQYREMFREEAKELLSELETALLELEDAPDDADIVGRAFRAMHTLKGSSGMFGFDEIAAFTHELETVFDLVRDGKLAVSREITDAALRARDHVRALLEGEADPDVGERLSAWLRRLAAGADTDAHAPRTSAAETVVDEEPADEGDHLRTWRIRFQPAPDLFGSGTDPLALFAELRDLGELHAVADTRRVPAIDEIEPDACHLAWDFILTTAAERDAIEDVFLFVADESVVRIERIAGEDDVDDEDHARLGAILVERGDVPRADLERVLARRPRVGELLVDEGVVTDTQVPAALVEQRALRERKKAKAGTRGGTKGSSSIRVAADKLDRLVDLVGELVIAQARLSQIAVRNDDPDLVLVAEDVERLTAELRDNTLGIRMLPIGTTFGRFRRLVRDLSGELGKEIVLETEGAETELDKTVIERLNDPLVHLIRNSIDHGIESPEARAAAGKPAAGTVRLSAVHSGAYVLIEVGDDGAGLDAGKIRRKAEERGIVAPDAELSDADVYDLVFAAGFSTAEQVSNVSGRGVGMDVVRRSIEALRGSVEIDSRAGQGTTIRIRLPLTLAIIEGLLVQVGDEGYVLPLASVEECVEMTRADIARAHGHRLVNVRGQLVPYVRLRDWFCTPGDAPPIEQTVVVDLDGTRFGFVVDHVVGQHQTVIKSLGRFYGDVDGLSGATILGDGTVALILDVPKLMAASSAGDGVPSLPPPGATGENGASLLH